MASPNRGGDYGRLPRLAWFEGKLAKVESFLTLSIFIIMLALMVVQVIFRYILEVALPWSEELIRFLFVATSFIGAALVSKERSHINIDIMDSLLGLIKNEQKREKINYWLWLMADITSLIVMSIFAVLTFRFLKIMHITEQVSPAMEFPVSVVVGTMLFGVCLMIIHYFFKIINNTFGFRQKREV